MKRARRRVFAVRFGRVGVVGSYGESDDNVDGYTVSIFNSGVLANLLF